MFVKIGTFDASKYTVCEFADDVVQNDTTEIKM